MSWTPALINQQDCQKHLALFWGKVFSLFLVPCCHLWLPSSPSLQLHQTLLLDKHILHPPPTPLFSPVTPTLHFPSCTHLRWPPTAFLSSHNKAYFSSLHVRLYFINILLPASPKALSQSQTKSHLVLNSALLAKHAFSFTNALYWDVTMIWNNLPSKSPFMYQAL